MNEQPPAAAGICPFANLTPRIPGIQPAPAASSKISFNPFTSAFIADPHPQLHELRKLDPVHYSRTLGVWVLTRHADIFPALRDPRFSSVGQNWSQYNKFFVRDNSPTSPLAQLYGNWMLQKDPPDHTRLRALVNKAFTPRVVQTMRPRIQSMIEQMIQPILPAGKIDLMSQLAFPLPTFVIGDLLGVPRQDYDKIRDWTTTFLPSLSPAMSAKSVATINEAIGQFQTYFRDLAEKRRAQPQDDLLTALLTARDRDDKLSEDELIATCILLAFAGHATTTQLIGKGMLALLQNPEQLELLRQDPTLIDSAVEEMLRYDAPLQILYRTTTEPVTLGDKTIPANQMVFLSLAAANRDPEQFPDPDRFDIRRAVGKHLSFAYGIHYCAGAPLARLETEIAINYMLRHLQNLQLQPEGVRRETSLLLRGLAVLPVTFRAEHQRSAA